MKKIGLKMKRKPVFIAVIASLLIAGLSVYAVANDSVVGDKGSAMRMKTAGIKNGHYIHYGEANAAHEGTSYKTGDDYRMQWRVLDAEKDNTGKSGALFMMTEKLIGPEARYAKDHDSKMWSDCNRRGWYNDFEINVFTKAEQNAIRHITKRDYSSYIGIYEFCQDIYDPFQQQHMAYCYRYKYYTYDDQMQNQGVFPMSYQELKDYLGTGSGGVAKYRYLPLEYQLRSPIWGEFYELIVMDSAPDVPVPDDTGDDTDDEDDEDDDDIVKEDYHNSYDIAIVDPYGTNRINRSGGLSIGDCRSKANTRPCTNLNQSTILFSNNVEKKEHLPLGKLSPVREASDNSWELTLEDPAHRGFSADVKSFSKETNVANIAVSGAQTGRYEYISAIIADGDQILWYGRLADCSSTAPESIEVKFDEDMLDALDGEDCKFYVFSEKCRGYKMTDYASPLDYIDIYDLNHSTVTFDMNGHGSPCPEPQSIRDGRTLTKPEDPAEPGYIFGGWYTSSECKDDEIWDFDNGIVNAPFTLYAKWTPVRYKIYFDNNGGNGTMQPQNRTYGEGTPLPECTFEPQDRFHFIGWNEKADGSGMMLYPGDTDDLSTEEGADVTLYAQWSDKYKVGYSLNGHGVPLPPDVEIEYPWILEEPEKPTETGYIFGGWYTSPECKDNEKWNFADTVQADMVLYAKWTPVTYIVHFDGNGGEGIMDYQIRVYDSGEPLPENEFTYDDYHIVSWNVKRDGTGESYPLDFTGNLADEQDADVTLYAQWEHSYTLHFDANNAEGKMADQNRCYGDGLSIPNNSFTRDHYTFEGWNTKADGSGTPYPDGFTGDIQSEDGETVTLYAQWMGNRCTLHFDANNGTGEMADQQRIYDDGLSLPPLAFTRDKYTFLCWNTRRDGKGESYPDGYTGNVFTDQSSMTLYAQWGNEYTVHYAPNGGTGNMDDQQRYHGDGRALTKNTFTRDGYAFVGWNTRPGGKGKIYKDEDTADLTDRAEKIVTLYAQWERAYTIHYDPNGGSGNMDDQFRYENDGKTLSKVQFENQHRSFEQWNTRPDGKGTSYADESEVDIPAEPGETVTLYAQWRYSFTVTFNTNNGSMEKEYERTTDDYGHVDFPDDPEPADPEESFYGWYTQRSGGIRVGSDEIFGSDTILYAHYRGLYNPPKNTTRTITFHLEPEYAVIDPYLENNKMTTSETGLISNMPTAIVDYNVFAGWYTMPGGGGIRITDGMVIWEDIDVYSYFCTYYVFFDGNGGEGSMEEQMRSNGDGKTLPLNEFTREGYKFTGWNTEKNGSGSSYPDGYLGDIGLPGYTFGYQTLFAQWEPLGVLPRVAFFDLNGHGSDRPSPQIVSRAQKWKLSEPDPDPSEKGYIFTGWYKYEECRDEWDFDHDSLEQLVTRLYAGWEAISYTVIFRANEPDGKSSSGTMLDQARTYDDGQALNTNTYEITDDESYEEFTFSGWNTKQDGSGDAFADKDKQNITDANKAKVTLYAQWNKAQITTASLPEGRLYLDYSAALTQQGVDDPVWSIVSGELIEGLTLSDDGVISGMPLQAETGRDITVQLKGRNPESGEEIILTRELTLSILEQEPVQIVFDANGHGEAPDPVLAVAPEWKIPEPDPTPTEEGYTLEGWYTDSECSDGNEWNFSNQVTSDMVLYAKWTPNRYVVEFDPGRGSGSMDAQNRVYGDGEALPTCTFTPPALANGAVFKEWNTKADGSGESYEDRSTQDIATEGTVTLYAQWSESRAAVFRLNGRGSGCPAPQIRGVMHGYKLTKPNDPVPESGYAFTDWYKEKECENKWDFNNDTLEKPKTVLYAGWKANTYTVKFSPNNPEGTIVDGDMDAQERVYDDNIALSKMSYEIKYESDPSKIFTFTGWNTKADGSGDAFGDEDVQNITDEDGALVTLYAQWNKAQITTSHLPRGTQSEPYSASLTFAGLREGTDSEWSISEGELPEGLRLDSETGEIRGITDQAGTFTFTVQLTGTDLMGEAVTLSRKFSLTIRQIDPEPYTLNYEIKFDLNGHGAPQPDAQFVTEPWIIEKPEDPEEFGYTFGGWYASASCRDGEKWNFDNPATDNMTLYAKWTKKEVRTAVFDLNGHGSDGPPPQVRGEIHDYKLKEPNDPTPEEGYIFTGWYKEKKCINKWDFENDTLSEAHTVLYAGWKAAEYTVEFNPNNPEGTSVEGNMDSQSREYGDGKSLPKMEYVVKNKQNASKTYTFTGWNTKQDGTGDAFGDEDAQDITDKAGAKITLYAQWNKAQITTSRLPRGTQSEPYNAILTFAGLREGSDVDWSIIDGDLPEGIVLDAKTGEISGTSDQAGTFIFTVKLTGTDLMGDAISLEKEFLIYLRAIDPEPLVIVFTEGMYGLWTKADTSDLSFKTNGPFEMFEGLDADGIELVAGQDYSASEGSTIINLKPSYLEKLDDGEHILTARYNDGQEPFAPFKIASKEKKDDDEDDPAPKPDDNDNDDKDKDKDNPTPKPDNNDDDRNHEEVTPTPDDNDNDVTPDNNKQNDNNKGKGNKKHSAKTGDGTHIAAWISLMLVTLSAIICLIIVRQRRRI